MANNDDGDDDRDDDVNKDINDNDNAALVSESGGPNFDPIAMTH